MTDHILTLEQIKWAYSKWISGYSQEEIAEALLVSAKTVQREFKRRGYHKVHKPLVYEEVEENG
jgi:IS30 family transposase